MKTDQREVHRSVETFSGDEDEFCGCALCRFKDQHVSSL